MKRHIAIIYHIHILNLFLLPSFQLAYFACFFSSSCLSLVIWNVDVPSFPRSSSTSASWWSFISTYFYQSLIWIFPILYICLIFVVSNILLISGVLCLVLGIEHKVLCLLSFIYPRSCFDPHVFVSLCHIVQTCYRSCDLCISP